MATHVELGRLCEVPAITIDGLVLLDELGHGGMGVVYRARQTQLERDVAVKLVASELIEDPTARMRFAREAKVLAKLAHPSIVQIHDFGETAEHCYLVMELVEGRCLADLMPLPPRRAIEIAIALCDALGHAHAYGIVHRDVKPSNVMVTPDGGVKLLDFGIARLVQSEITRGWIGTPHYMAPEAFTGTVDPRLDVYSLAMLLREAMPAAMPARIAELVNRALAIDPDARPSLRELEAGLRRAIDGSSPRRRPFVSIVLATATLTITPIATRPHEVSVAARVTPAAAPVVVPPLAEGTLAPNPPAPTSYEPSVVPRRTTRVEPARLVIKARPWAILEIDGRDGGRVEPPHAVLELTAGVHSIVLANPRTGRSVTRKIRLRSSATETITVDLRPRAGDR